MILTASETLRYENNGVGAQRAESGGTQSGCRQAGDQSGHWQVNECHRELPFATLYLLKRSRSLGGGDCARTAGLDLLFRAFVRPRTG